MPKHRDADRQTQIPLERHNLFTTHFVTGVVLSHAISYRHEPANTDPSPVEGLEQVFSRSYSTDSTSYTQVKCVT